MLVLSLCVLNACSSEKANTQSSKTSTPSTQRSGGCTSPDPTQALPAPTATTLSTLEQAYWCLLDHHVTRKTLDNRTLLDGAFSAMVQELLSKNLDQSTAMPPSLTGDAEADWLAFSTIYQRVSKALSQDAKLQQELAAATLKGMVQSLHDNHTFWNISAPASVLKQYPQGVNYGLGIVTSATSGASYLPEARSPLFVTEVLPNSPAEQQHIVPGDSIVSVNGSTPFTNNQLNPGVMSWLNPQLSSNAVVHVTLSRPKTGRTWTVTLTPTFFAPSMAPVASARSGQHAGLCQADTSFA